MTRATLLLALVLLPTTGHGQSSLRDSVLSAMGRRVAVSHARTAATLVGGMDSCTALIAPEQLCTEVAYTSTALATALALTPTPDHAARSRELRTAHFVNGAVAGRSCNGNPGAVTVLLPGPLSEIEPTQRWRIALSVLYVSSSDVPCQAQGALFEYLASRDPRTGRIVVTGPTELLLGHGARTPR
jgi:hypothetical protein